MDQGSTRKRSAVHNFAPTVTKFCVMWEGQALPHDTKFGNSRCEIVGRRRVIFIWSLIHGSSWSGLIKVGPNHHNHFVFSIIFLWIRPLIQACRQQHYFIFCHFFYIIYQHKIHKSYNCMITYSSCDSWYQILKVSGLKAVKDLLINKMIFLHRSWR